MDERENFRNGLREGMAVRWKDPEGKGSGLYRIMEICTGCGLPDEVTENTHIEIFKNRGKVIIGVPVSQVFPP